MSIVRDQLRPFQGVYVIGPESDGPMKVGISAVPCHRLRGLQSGSWRRLTLFMFSYFVSPRRGTIGAARMYEEMSENARDVEAGCHSLFRKCDLALCGEWAAVTADEAVESVRKVAGLRGLVEVHCGPSEPFDSEWAESEDKEAARFEAEAWRLAQAHVAALSKQAPKGRSGRFLSEYLREARIEEALNS